MNIRFGSVYKLNLVTPQGQPVGDKTTLPGVEQLGEAFHQLHYQGEVAKAQGQPYWGTFMLPSDMNDWDSPMDLFYVENGLNDTDAADFTTRAKENNDQVEALARSEGDLTEIEFKAPIFEKIALYQEFAEKAQGELTIVAHPDGRFEKLA